MTDHLSQVRSQMTEVHSLSRVIRLLQWDQQTVMPEGSTSDRGHLIALVERLRTTALVTADGMLDRLDPRFVDSLDPESDDACLVRLMRRDAERVLRVPERLRGELARSAALAIPAWRAAKAQSDFSIFRDELKRTFELRHRYIECFDEPEDPYDIVLQDHEPELSTATVEHLFGEIRPELVSLTSELDNRRLDRETLNGHFSVSKQVELQSELMRALGADTAVWRVDAAEHPFHRAIGYKDIRLTTRYDESDLSSLFYTMHEYGHGLYERQIPSRIAHLPIGAGASRAWHESQSRLWENQVGRSLPFWRFFFSKAQRVFPKALSALSAEGFLATVNQVRPSLIRVRADEVTYGLHIIVRFELERELMSGVLEVDELPARWREKMWTHLGVEVRDDANGVLQDIHWAWGQIGYFPTYLLGSVIASQIWEKAVAEIPDIEGEIARGDLGNLREWLRTNVHAHGRKFTPEETLRRAVGSGIDARPYISYLRGKYLMA